jgi:uncharacterized membrane protein
MGYSERMPPLATIGLYAMAVLYILAGILHFLKPRMYLRMMPPWIPYHRFMVYASGVVEIACGALLLWPEWTSFAAWGIIGLLIAVFPANVYMLTSRKFKIAPALLWVRLPLQCVLILWAFYYTKP